MKRLTVAGASLVGASLAAVGLVLWFLPGDVVESSYSSLQSAREDHLFDRGWLPDILPPSSSKITTSNNLDLNTSRGSFELSPNEWSLLEVKLAPGSIGAPFADWSGTLAGHRERGFRPWNYASSDVRWVLFCKPNVGRCEYVMWVSREGLHFNRRGPTTAGCGFAAHVGGPVIFTLNAFMKSIAKRNMIVGGALMTGVSVLVVVETRFLSEPPQGVWFFAMVLFSLGGFLWANAHAFSRLENPVRALLAGTLGVAVWLVAVFLVVTIGVNLKFALGGHV